MSTTINLDALRSSITIIPQQSDLMSGTVRQILDPFDEHDDVQIFIVVQGYALWCDTTRWTGDTDKGGDCTTNMVPLILALSNPRTTRDTSAWIPVAIVRKSKVLILDEATADYNTDNAI
ncbi:hypothetical protein BDV93DRAFT_565891 [Ceratobasidium sp. AG-I]|nr:hypothetical protein BDV93DRAFT_565891 [Ceratobasidium sp. AG-I]